MVKIERDHHYLLRDGDSVVFSRNITASAISDNLQGEPHCTILRKDTTAGGVLYIYSTQFPAHWAAPTGIRHSTNDAAEALYFAPKHLVGRG